MDNNSAQASDSADRSTERENEALREMGLRPNRLSAPDDFLTSILLRYVQNEMNALSIADTALLLAISEGDVLQRIESRMLYGFTFHHEWQVPTFQFVDNKVIPGLEIILPMMNAKLQPLSVKGFFTRPKDDLVLEGRSVSPVEWLSAGNDPGIVADLAKDLLRTP